MEVRFFCAALKSGSTKANIYVKHIYKCINFSINRFLMVGVVPLCIIVIAKSQQSPFGRGNFLSYFGLAAFFRVEFSYFSFFFGKNTFSLFGWCFRLNLFVIWTKGKKFRFHYGLLFSAAWNWGGWGTCILSILMAHCWFMHWLANSFNFVFVSSVYFLFRSH